VLAACSPRRLQLAKREIDVAQQAVRNLWRLDAADDALALGVGIVDDDLDRVDALSSPTRGGAATTQKLCQLGTQAVVNRLVKAQAYEAPLLLGQPDPLVVADRDLHPPADKPASAIRTSQSAALIASRTRRTAADSRRRLVPPRLAHTRAPFMPN
jgi:hypothetical protein